MLIVPSGRKTRPDTPSRIAKNENERLLGDAYHDLGYVVCTDDGLPYRPNYISDIFSYLFVEPKYKGKRKYKVNSHPRITNLPQIRLHDLRGCFVSIANAADVNLLNISEACGHSRTDVTRERYMYIFNEIQSVAVDAVSESVKKAKDRLPAAD